MRRWLRGLLVASLVLLVSSPGFAATGLPAPGFPIPAPVREISTVLVAFNPVTTTYTPDFWKAFNLGGDGKDDILISADTVTGLGGTTLQLLEPPQMRLSDVQKAPATGYGTTAPLAGLRVYMAKLPDGGYAKFYLLNPDTDCILRFSYGRPATSELKADTSGGHVVLTWGALPDAALGYNIYRYSPGKGDQAVPLVDFPLRSLTFTDDSVVSGEYVYSVVSVKADGFPGSPTTSAGAFVSQLVRTMKLPLSGTATLDGGAITLESPLVLQGGRLMVPASVLQKAGFSVVYDAVAGTITLERKPYPGKNATVVMRLGALYYSVDGTDAKTTVAPYLSGSTVMVPLRPVAEGLQVDVTFDQLTQTATLKWLK